MEYRDDLISDFAERTLKNLDFIQDRVRSDGAGLYEVTQLWNSLLGLVVLPLETDTSRIPETPMSQLVSAGWPRITTDEDRDVSLHDVVWNLRNAVAHANVTFVAGPDRQIRSVKVCNVYRGQVKWRGRASVGELDRLVRLLAALYRDTYTKAA